MLGTAEICERITSGLAALARRKRSEISAVLDALGLPKKAIHETVHCGRRIHLERILDLVGAFSEDRLRFLARRLEILAEPEDYLSSIEGDEPLKTRAVQRLRVVAKDMEAAAPGPADPARGLAIRSPESISPAAAEKLAAFHRLSFSKGMAALYRDASLRDPEVAWALLDHWHELRWRTPPGASRMTVAAAIGLIPKIEGDRHERLALFCEALGVFAAIERLRGNPRTSAFALRKALEITGAGRLESVRMRQVRRCAVLLRDTGLSEPSLRLQADAIAFYETLGDSQTVGRILASRGVTLAYQGTDDLASRAFLRALELLPLEDPLRSRRWRVLAWNGLSYSALAQDQVADASSYLEKAIGEHGDEVDTIAGDLRWRAARLAARRDRSRDALALLAEARLIYEACSFPKAALVAVDQVRILIDQGAFTDAQALARATAPLLRKFQHFPAAAAALMDLQLSASRGRLTLARLAAIERCLVRELGDAGSRDAGAPARSGPLAVRVVQRSHLPRPAVGVAQRSHLPRPAAGIVQRPHPKRPVDEEKS